jgi:hypothetical protein
MYSIPLQFFIQSLYSGFFGLCHFVGLMVFGLIPLKTYAPNISADNSDWKKKIQGKIPTTNFLALVSLGLEK